MLSGPEKQNGIGSILGWFTSTIGRILISIIVPVFTFVVLWQGFIFLRDSNAPKLIIVLVAMVWGVGGVALLFLVTNWLVERLGEKWRSHLLPYVFIGPAMALLIYFLALPAFRTFYLSLFNANSSEFIGFENYVFTFTDRAMLEAYRNNLLWLLLGTSLCVTLGLLIAVLADRSKYENIFKALIFLPMAISFVGSGIIWRFIYYFAPPGREQIGVLNAIVTGLGGEPQAWLTLLQPWNNYFLIVIMIWLQTGYAMVLFSAAIKGIPADLMEAARVDGANEFQIFFHITIPSIMGTLITVTTTIIIFTLKLFDIVIVMTGGQYGTHVIATQFYRQFFTNRNFGVGSAIAIVLLIAVIPVMIYNLRSFNERKAFR
ncbi:MAG: ABC transporter [Chloroflexi bacterium HGW-Chloroflexi-10]|nr:MAG: ABC transporter [Chloroflexi bacterium HGW-Chloroflexi-10]